MELDKDFREFIGLLNENEVQYLVVGGYSVAHYGFPRFTGDFDIWINPTLTNGRKMLKVLEDFGFGSMGIKAQDFVQANRVIQFGVEPLRIDVITTIDGIGNFNDAYQNRDKSMYDHLQIDFIGYQDLITNKTSSNRLQDQRDIRELERVNKKA